MGRKRHLARKLYWACAEALTVSVWQGKILVGDDEAPCLICAKFIGTGYGVAMRATRVKGERILYAVEFEATIKDGQIEVPDELRKSLSTHVRVILLTAEPHQRTQSMIQQLMENPIRVEDPQPLSRSEIYGR